MAILWRWAVGRVADKAVSGHSVIPWLGLPGSVGCAFGPRGLHMTVGGFGVVLFYGAPAACSATLRKLTDSSVVSKSPSVRTHDWSSWEGSNSPQGSMIMKG